MTHVDVIPARARRPPRRRQAARDDSRPSPSDSRSSSRPIGQTHFTGSWRSGRTEGGRDALDGGRDARVPRQARSDVGRALRRVGCSKRSNRRAHGLCRPRHHDPVLRDGADTAAKPTPRGPTRCAPASPSWWRDGAARRGPAESSPTAKFGDPIAHRPAAATARTGMRTRRMVVVMAGSSAGS